MAATPPPAAPPGWGQNPPPPPNWGQAPPPPAWSPQGQPPGQPMAAAPMSNPMASMQNRMEKMESRASGYVTIFRVLGFALIFVAALVVVIGTNPPSNCFSTSPPSNCGLNYANGAANATLVGRILAVLGFSAILMGSALRLQFSLRPTADSKPEEYQFLARERTLNMLVILVSLVLLFLVAELVPVITGAGPGGGLINGL